MQNKFIYKKNSLMLFFFPLHPFKVFKNIRLISVVAMLISLRFIMQYFTFYIPSVGMSISFAWSPLVIIGWIFGPVTGFFIGFLTDTITFVMKPNGVWFWLHAIQEPLVGFIAGLIGSLYFIRSNSIKKNFKIDFFINQFFLFFFSVISGIIFFVWLQKDDNKFEGSSKVDKSIFLFSIITMLLGFFIFIIIIEFIIFFTWKNHKNKILILFWIINLTILLSTIFSFLLGVISTIEYYKFINGSYSPYFKKYGVLFYLFPRLIKELIKVPIQNIIFFISIPFCVYKIKTIKKNLCLKWN